MLQMKSLSESGFIEALGKPEIGYVRRTDGKPLEAVVSEYIFRPSVVRFQSWLSHEIKIIDFGEASLQSSVPKTIRTPLAIRAPEFVFKNLLDHRVDLWSMGCSVSPIARNRKESKMSLKFLIAF
jgi:serine/threonine protein kinase